jgi:hypothetical protein
MDSCYFCNATKGMFYDFGDIIVCKNCEEKLIRHIIPCLGIDGLIHKCFPEKDTTLCSMKIASKKIVPELYCNHYWCCECDGW